MGIRDLPVFYFCEHLTLPYSVRQQTDWDALWFVKACKGESLATMPAPTVFTMNGRRHRLTQGEPDVVIEWFGDWVSEWSSRALRIANRPLALVPIPASTATVGASSAGRTRAFAESAAVGIEGGYVLDVLRWTELRPRAREGGSRDQAHLSEYLTLIEAVRPDELVMLVDDVVTTGGHMAACAALLWDEGARVVGGLAAAHAVHERTKGSAFAPRSKVFDVNLEWWDPFVDGD